jgi:nucleoside-diphosphate kinase
MAYEVTCTLIKPHIVKGKNSTANVLDIMTRYLQQGLVITDIKCFQANEDFLREFYNEHVTKVHFYTDIIPTMTSGKTVALTLAGDDAVRKAREINGATDPKEAAPGTIRANYGTEVKFNAVHASDSAESAIKEIFLVGQA